MVPLVSAIFAAVAALAGVFLGARLTQQREANNWSRDQRLKAYAELLAAIEECFDAFTLLAASFRGWDYEWERIDRERPKVLKLLADWGAGDEKIGKTVTAAELIASRELWPMVMATRFVSGRQRMLLMQFDYLRQIDPAEWAAVEGKAHGTLLELRSALRSDIQRTLDDRARWPAWGMRRVRRVVTRASGWGRKTLRRNVRSEVTS